MSVIFIKNLVVEGTHGVNSFEKVQKQRFSISVELSCDTLQAERTDDIEDTISWSDLRMEIINIVQKNSFNLMERLAAELTDQLLEDQRIQSITLTVEKLDAFKSGVPGVTIVRKKL